VPQAEQHFIERMGVILGSDGLSRIAGRIFGLLGDAEALGVSKASVSLEARRLEQRGMVERVSRPGDRRDYYRVAPNLLAGMMEQRMRRWRALQDTIVETRAQLAGRASSAVLGRLDHFAAGSEFTLGVLADAIARWRDDDRTRTRSTPAPAGRGRAAR